MASSPDIRGNPGALRDVLLRWFRDHQRPLPFRDTVDPWAIWVSEVMLQQTRVEAMLPRYRSFLARFPDPAALAAASEDEVLAAWSGLGYYGRARALHRAAREVGRSGFPDSAAGLGALPGIGAYTAAAVASIAFAEPVAAVDGNVRRVLSRLFAVSGRPDRAPFRKRIARLADGLMAAGGGAAPGEWNQALMELGALVCTPASPRCGVCPLRDRCRAYREGRADELPEQVSRRKTVFVRLANALVRDGRGRLLLFRRRTGPLRGLYELPGGPCRPEEPPRAALVREAAARHRLALTPEKALLPFPHTVMNRRITVHCFRALIRENASVPPAGRWTAPAELDRVPSGAILKKALARLETAASGEGLLRRKGSGAGASRKDELPRSSHRASPKAAPAKAGIHDPALELHR